MPRTHGYAKKGERCFDVSHYTNKKRTNVIGALSNHQLLQTRTFQTPINSDHFKSFIQNLLSTLDEPSVIVMDNASFHKKKDNRLPSKLTKPLLSLMTSYVKLMLGDENQLQIKSSYKISV